MATGLSWGAAGGAATVSGEVGPAAFENVRPSATTSALPVWQGLNGGAVGRAVPARAGPEALRDKRSRDEAGSA